MDLVLQRANSLQNTNYREQILTWYVIETASYMIFVQEIKLEKGLSFFHVQYLFPIHKNGHHYIISYNIKYPAWEILDNIGGCTDIEQRYGTLPYTLVRFLKYFNWVKVYSFMYLQNRLCLKNSTNYSYYGCKHMRFPNRSRWKI